MSVSLVLTFPLGRFHATPWNQLVNEGAVEIPPSPWRLLRMLYSVWKIRRPDLSEADVHGLLLRLGAEPPFVYVPEHTLAHTRHYYPDAAHGTDRTLDAFAVFGADDDLALRWTSLEAGQIEVLRQLAAAIPYFGRADSICDGRVEIDWTPSGHEVWQPLDVADSVDAYDTTARVLTPVKDFAVGALEARPADIRRQKLDLPPGAKWIAYGRAKLETGRRVRTYPPHERRVTAVRFDLLSAALPPEFDALRYTDLLRQAGIKKLEYSSDGTMLGGRNADGTPMQGAQHAHYLPVIRDRRIQSLVVWVPGGLPEKEIAALTNIDRLTGYRIRMAVRVSGIGNIDHVAPELVGSQREWHSTTPFTPSRYRKKRDWATFAASEIRRELDVRGLPEPAGIEFFDGSWTSFVRYRPSARERHDVRQGQAHDESRFVRLRFTESITGPITLGRLSHFGLGLFVPVG